MPSFPDFEYFFAVDVLGLSIFAINMSTVIGCIGIFILPLVFQKYLIDKEYRVSFFLSQFCYVFSVTINLCLALKVNKRVPTLLLYILSGPIAQINDKVMTMMPCNIIMSKTIPLGVEATMFSFAHTIMNLNLFTLRSLMGVLINDNFVHVTKEDFSNFYVLQVIALLGALVPFTYIYFMIPT